MDPVVFGERIRLARERLRYTQTDLAFRVGKDQRAISEYENGQRKLAATDLTLFAKVLEVPVTYFYTGQPDTENLEETLLHDFRALNFQGQRILISIARAIASELVDE